VVRVGNCNWNADDVQHKNARDEENGAVYPYSQAQLVSGMDQEPSRTEEESLAYVGPD
jgi:hypothetical protein